jgi:hypothetical protein
MNRLTTLVVGLGVALNAPASELNQEILVVTYPDFVAFDLVSESHDLETIVVGPEGYRHERRYPSDQTAYLEAQSPDDGALADGLYKWEAWATPRKVIPREVSSAMPDRNAMHTSSRSGRISGSFRVVEGLIVDPDLAEAPNSERPVGEVRP